MSQVWGHERGHLWAGKTLLPRFQPSLSPRALISPCDMQGMWTHSPVSHRSQVCGGAGGTGHWMELDADSGPAEPASPQCNRSIPPPPWHPWCRH